MQFLKILFWCLLAFLAAIFTIGNWTTVQIKLWGGLVAEVNLPLLLLVTFLLGLLPMLLYHHLVRWRLGQRLTASRNAVETLRAVPAAVPTPPAPMPPVSTPPARPLDADPPVPTAPVSIAAPIDTP